MIINGSDFELRTSGEGGPLVIAALGHENDPDGIFDAVKEKTLGKPFAIAFLRISDWNGQLSPWPSEGPFGDRFRGGAGETLKLLEEAVPRLKDQCPGSAKVYIAGYSLAGLFSLWTLYASDIFCGCASCSGSMWFEGWTDCAKNTGLKKPCIVYLSLGGKEERTGDPVMATIGETTRAMEKILKADPNVKRSTLEMNPGGHFSDPSGRLAKGIAWLVNNGSR